MDGMMDVRSTRDRRMEHGVNGVFGLAPRILWRDHVLDARLG